MSRRKRVKDSTLSPQTLYGMQIADGMRPDPIAPAAMVKAGPDGGPPAELIEAYVAAAHAQGCNCDEPDIEVIRSSQGGGVLSILHGPRCPLINRLDEEAADG